MFAADDSDPKSSLDRYIVRWWKSHKSVSERACEEFRVCKRQITVIQSTYLPPDNYSPHPRHINGVGHSFPSSEGCLSTGYNRTYHPAVITGTAILCPIFNSGARSSNELHWHDLKIGYHDNNPSNDCRVACPIKWLKIYPCLAKIMMIQSVLSSNYPLLCIDCFSWSGYLGTASDSTNYHIP